MHSKVKRKPPLWLSLVPFVSLILIMLPSVIILGADPQIPLIICIGITAFIGFFVLGYSWSDIENAMIESNAAAMQANFIIMLVGCLMGVWMSGGVVPGLIYYGLKLFTPGIFLAALPILCAIISISTGSAWTTAGTIGVSAMGVAAGLGIPFPIAAGAIITGAQFGDKLSPLSDSTNLAAGITGANLFTHVRHMLWSTIPSFVLAVGCFAVIGAGYSGSNVDDSQIQMICDVLQANFHITPWILLAPLSIILIMILHVPAIPGMAVGTAIGVIFALVQGNSLGDIMQQMLYGFELTSGSDSVDKLLNRGGMQSMMYTISLVICALAFGGAIKCIGCLDVFIETILLSCRTRASIMIANIFFCIGMNFLAADQYMSIVIPGQMFKETYKKLNLAPENLSRLLEDAGTLTSGIVPWSTCGALYYSVLGVSAFVYFPFCFMAYLNPLISALYAVTGFKLTPLDPSKPIRDRLEDIEEI